MFADIERILPETQTTADGISKKDDNVETMELVRPSSSSPFSNETTLKFWLNSIGMNEYLELFIKEGFGDDIAQMRALTNLTDNQLKSIGINKLAHRLLILDGIRALNEGGMNKMNMHQSVVQIGDEGKVKGNGTRGNASSSEEEAEDKETNTKRKEDSSEEDDEDDDMYKEPKIKTIQTEDSTSL